VLPVGPATVARAITGAAGAGPGPPGAEVGAGGRTGADTVAITGWLPVTDPTPEPLSGLGAPATTGTVVAPAAAVGGLTRTVASVAFDTGVGSGGRAAETGVGGLGGADGVVGVGSDGFTPGAPDPATGVGAGRVTAAVAMAGATGGRLTAVGPVIGPVVVAELAGVADPVALGVTASVDAAGPLGVPVDFASAGSGDDGFTGASVTIEGDRATNGLAGAGATGAGSGLDPSAVGAEVADVAESDEPGALAEPSGRRAVVASSSAPADCGASTGSSPGGVEAPAIPDFACVSVIGTIRS
jgi:hypothetical protein